jgi:hypothetical protein
MTAARERLPNRRAAIAFDFTHNGSRFHVHAGRLTRNGDGSAGGLLAAVLDLVEAGSP